MCPGKGDIMTIKWIGAALVIAGCGSWGFSLAAAYCYQERVLRCLDRTLQMLQWELTYRLTPLPELCGLAAREAAGELRNVFRELGQALDGNIQSDAAGCMAVVLKQHPNLPPKARRLLRQLGRTLGRFELEGQIQGMNSVRTECSAMIGDLHRDREIRLRSYRTLGLCAGAALVILFI